MTFFQAVFFDVRPRLWLLRMICLCSLLSFSLLWFVEFPDLVLPFGVLSSCILVYHVANAFQFIRLRINPSLDLFVLLCFVGGLMHRRPTVNEWSSRMFSRSDHHHQRQRASSLSVSLGTRRPRSPETTPPESESDEAKASHQKKSPHTKRTVKKGRTTYTPATDNGPDTPAFPPPHAQPLSTDVPPAKSHHHAPAPQTQPEPEAVTAQVKHLESLLDSVLATLVIIQAATHNAVTLNDHSRQALKMLNTLLPLEDQVQATSSFTSPVPTSESANHPKRSYADAAKPCQVTPKTTHYARSSPAGATAWHRPSTANRRSPHQHPHSANRLIARWDGVSVPQSSSSLVHFVRNLNDMLQNERNPGARGESPRKILAANVTKLGNVVIHTVNNAVAAELQNHRQMIWDCASAIPDFVRPSYLPILEVDVPWYGVVIHDLPAESLRHSFDTADSFDDIWTLLEEEGGLVSKDVRGKLRVLCQDGEEFEKEHLSMLIRFEDQHVCERLCRDGIYLLGSWHRVSRYRERKKRTIPTPSPAPTPPKTTSPPATH